SLSLDDERLHEQVRRIRAELAARYPPESLIGRTPAMARARAQIELAATTRECVLIVGPRGSGKDHAAKAIHYAQRQRGPLVPLDCAVLEPNLLRSTLRGTWSRSTIAKDVLTTLLLDNVDRMPPEAQSDLLELVTMRVPGVRVIATAETSLDE